MRSATMAIDCTPDEQKRLTVMAATSSGRPAASAATRATFIPCSASGMAQPRTTSSTSLPSMPGARASASRMTCAPMSSGRVSLRPPLRARPNGVLTPLTIATSFISIPQRLVVHEHVLDALARLLFTDESDEGFALQVEDVLLGHPQRRRSLAAAEHPRQLRADDDVVGGDLVGGVHHLQAGT